MFSLPVSVWWGGLGLPAAIAFGMFFCAFEPIVNAQTTHIRGQVADRATGEALPGASVWLIGTYDGATADLDGHFAFTTERRGAHFSGVCGSLCEAAAIVRTPKAPRRHQDQLRSAEAVLSALMCRKPDFTQAPESGGSEAFLFAKKLAPIGSHAKPSRHPHGASSSPACS